MLSGPGSRESTLFESHKGRSCGAGTLHPIAKALIETWKVPGCETSWVPRILHLHLLHGCTAFRVVDSVVSQLSRFIDS